MRNFFTGLKLIGRFGLLAAGLCSCASTEVQNTGSLLSAAGFRPQSLSPQAGLTTYNQVTPYKLERDTVNGHSVYLYANMQKGVVYVGGDQAYQRYGQLVRQQAAAENAEEAAYTNYLKNIDQNHSLNYE
jgi:hypothetical protein